MFSAAMPFSVCRRARFLPQLTHRPCILAAAHTKSVAADQVVLPSVSCDSVSRRYGLGDFSGNTGAICETWRRISPSFSSRPVSISSRASTYAVNRLARYMRISASVAGLVGVAPRRLVLAREDRLGDRLEQRHETLQRVLRNERSSRPRFSASRAASAARPGLKRR